MKKGEAIEILEALNKWRRGGVDYKFKPLEVGVAIDLAIKELKNKTKKNK